MFFLLSVTLLTKEVKISTQRNLPYFVFIYEYPNLAHYKVGLNIYFQMLYFSYTIVFKHNRRHIRKNT